ncbi:MAG: hypothetical protein ACRC7O_12330, partial [Fimbriiglobus sp.]
AKGNTLTLTQNTYDFATYNPAGRIATPAPPEFATQSDSGSVAYQGDKWPRADGGRGTSGAWATHVSANTWTENWAYTLKQFLGARTFPADTYTAGVVYEASPVPDNDSPPGMRTTADNDGTTGIDGRRLRLRAGGRNFRIPGQSDHTTQSGETGYGSVVTSGTWELRDGGDTNFNFRDRIWERFGYDLNVVDYRANNGAPTSGSVKEVNLLAEADRFKGFSMGPGYWGKTFFMWPPDPRWGAPGVEPPSGTITINPHQISTTPSERGIKDTAGNWIADWRCRFFLRGDSTTAVPVYFNPQRDDINTILFTTAAGHVLHQPSSSATSNQPGFYQINYRAVMAWIKANVKVFPENLRAGRFAYYKSIPDDCDSSGTADVVLDKRFWREYIHFVLGVGTWDTTNRPVTTPTIPGRVLAGLEYNFGLNHSVGVASNNFNPNGTTDDATAGRGQQPKPYMAYTDNINRPRLHFWFGPLSMLHFLEYGDDSTRPWYAGTIREAQSWQLKAAMSSALDDVRVNHPNDNCGLAFFAGTSEFNGPRAPMGQDWFLLKNALYFRRDVANILKVYPNDPVEYRPYDSNFNNLEVRKIPNSNGGTDPNNGLAIAYNLLSSADPLPATESITSPSGNTVSNAPLYGNKGRRGSSKIVVFETDGVPSSSGVNWGYTGTGADTHFVTGGGTAPSETGISSVNGNANKALAVARVITANTTDTPAGLSTPSSKCRIYSIGFGDIFEGWPNYASMLGSGRNAHDFMLTMQKMGFTSASGDTRLPERHIITGPYEQPDPSAATSATNPLGRIEQLRDCLERVMQSGVQVTLIQ